MNNPDQGLSNVARQGSERIFLHSFALNDERSLIEPIRMTSMNIMGTSTTVWW